MPEVFKVGSEDPWGSAVRSIKIVLFLLEHLNRLFWKKPFLKHLGIKMIKGMCFYLSLWNVAEVFRLEKQYTYNANCGKSCLITVIIWKNCLTFKGSLFPKLENPFPMQEYRMLLNSENITSWNQKV